ncbi:MAG TPA: DUF4267 domain-containing protein [Hyphomicrobiaceae bacterium]|nr:DUF4267 domain-containing protein [Hyphomicrobiaceae bacterium]
MLVACGLGGVLLIAIGVRYLLVPDAAARAFGLAYPMKGSELHYVVGLRNIWLGLLAMGFVALRAWSALALWFATGALVCFADAAIAAASSGKVGPIAFHVVSGVICVALAGLLLGKGARQGQA